MNRKRAEREIKEGCLRTRRQPSFFIHFYQKQAEVHSKMWVKCNPNPLGKMTGDCVIRALSIALDQSWRETYRDLCQMGEYMADLPNSNAVWGTYLKEKGARQFLLPESCPDCITVRAFCDRYPEGVYVIATGTHAIACISGDYYDSWDSGMATPTMFWRVK